jgi:hypothetical protein
VSKLACLGSGFQLLAVGGPSNLGAHLLKSVPLEMNVDHLAVMSLASGSDAPEQPSGRTASASGSASAPPVAGAVTALGCISARDISRRLGWAPERIESCLALLLDEGMAWIDTQGTEVSYGFPSIALAQ